MWDAYKEPAFLLGKQKDTEAQIFLGDRGTAAVTGTPQFAEA
jgi:hypothetical protein